MLGKADFAPPALESLNVKQLCRPRPLPGLKIAGRATPLLPAEGKTGPPMKQWSVVRQNDDEFQVSYTYLWSCVIG